MSTFMRQYRRNQFIWQGFQQTRGNDNKGGCITGGKGRMDSSAENGATFSLGSGIPKIPVDKSADSGKAEPYNGVFAKYGY